MILLIKDAVGAQRRCCGSGEMAPHHASRENAVPCSKHGGKWHDANSKNRCCVKQQKKRLVMQPASARGNTCADSEGGSTWRGTDVEIFCHVGVHQRTKGAWAWAYTGDERSGSFMVQNIRGAWMGRSGGFMHRK